MRRVLKYPGSKWNVARKLVSMIPPHHSYVEPFFGSGAVLFNKLPSDIETINDLDDDVVNLFRCIRDDAECLAMLAMATPYSRAEYEASFMGVPLTGIQPGDDRYKKACRFLVQCWQGHGFRTNGYKVGWKHDVIGRERSYTLRDWCRLPEWIIEVAERLKMVQIEQRPALEVMGRFDYEDVFMYLDPPYLLNTRSGEQYKNEMTDADHEEMLLKAMGSRAKIMISGYASDMYDDYLKGWHRVELKSCAEGGKPRTEVVWMNYENDGQMDIYDFLGTI